jgi:hypothetical protein
MNQGPPDEPPVMLHTMPWVELPPHVSFATDPWHQAMSVPSYGDAAG